MVKPGERIGTLWVIDSGLKAGERVIVEGLQKVRAGIKVKPETVTIEEAAAPAPPAAAAAATAEQEVAPWRASSSGGRSSPSSSRS